MIKLVWIMLKTIRMDSGFDPSDIFSQFFGGNSPFGGGSLFGFNF